MTNKPRNYSNTASVAQFNLVMKASSFVRNIEFIFSKFVKKQNLVLHSFIGMVKERQALRDEPVKVNSSFERSGYNRNKPSGKTVKTILLVLGLAVLSVGAYNVLGKLSTSKGENTNPEVKAARATTSVNKEFSYPLKDSKGKEVAKVKYLVENAEIRDEILVKGARATAVKGRVFLILTVKITNDYTGSIEMNTKDYVRLSVNGNENEWLAPDIHNDPVEVQAISTKYSRLGFAINETDKDFVITVGEIGGEKVKVSLEFN